MIAHMKLQSTITCPHVMILQDSRHEGVLLVTDDGARVLHQMHINEAAERSNSTADNDEHLVRPKITARFRSGCHSLTFLSRIKMGCHLQDGRH